MFTPHITPIRNRRNQGFTLIELMTTIIIIGILTTVALPSLRSLIADQRVKNSAFDVMSMLSITRSEALKRNTNVIASSNSGGWQSGWSVSAGSSVLSSQPAFSGLTITCKTAGAVTTCPATITYSTNGHISAASALPSFEITGSGSSVVRCISIDLSGRPISISGSCS